MFTTRLVSMCALAATLCLASIHSYAGGGGGKGGGGGDGGKGGGGGGGHHHDEDLILPKQFIISIKDRKSGAIQTLLTCRKPASDNYEKRVTIGMLADPSTKLSYGCFDYTKAISIRSYDEFHE